jgi:hypothetical protein
MASDTPPGVPGTDEREYTSGQLLAMDEEEARRTLTVDQYEAREKLQNLHDQAAETKARWAEEDEAVHDIVVEADPEALGTFVDLYGNEVLVRVREDDEQLKAAMDGIAEDFRETPQDDIPELDADRRAVLAGYLRDIYDAMLVRWREHEWADLSAETREAILRDAQDKWGLKGLFVGFVRCMVAIRENDEEVVEMVDSFLGAEGGRGRGDLGRDGVS